MLIIENITTEKFAVDNRPIILWDGLLSGVKYRIVLAKNGKFLVESSTKKDALDNPIWTSDIPCETQVLGEALKECLDMIIQWKDL